MEKTEFTGRIDSIRNYSCFVAFWVSGQMCSSHEEFPFSVGDSIRVVGRVKNLEYINAAGIKKHFKEIIADSIERI